MNAETTPDFKSLFGYGKNQRKYVGKISVVASELAELLIAHAIKVEDSQGVFWFYVDDGDRVAFEIRQSDSILALALTQIGASPVYWQRQYYKLGKTITKQIVDAVQAKMQAPVAESAPQVVLATPKFTVGQEITISATVDDFWGSLGTINSIRCIEEESVVYGVAIDGYEDLPFEEDELCAIEAHNNVDLRTWDELTEDAQRELALQGDLYELVGLGLADASLLDGDKNNLQSQLEKQSRMNINLAQRNVDLERENEALKADLETIAHKAKRIYNGDVDLESAKALALGIYSLSRQDTPIVEQAPAIVPTPSAPMFSVGQQVQIISHIDKVIGTVVHISIYGKYKVSHGLNQIYYTADELELYVAPTPEKPNLSLPLPKYTVGASVWVVFNYGREFGLSNKAATIVEIKQEDGANWYRVRYEISTEEGTQFWQEYEILPREAQS